MDFNRLVSVESSNSRDLHDIIELKDGTRISSEILQVSNDEISFINTRSAREERLSASAISVLHLEKTSLSIPFPLNPSDHEDKQTKVQNQIDQIFLQHKITI